ncbi:MAG: GNAT family N-acetyltransferase [Candidatus Gastranaerophilales bacterium]|nr:GNAT family N-acetyltransferase [Candidatus Gastranaerophilales bacterium]
MNYLQKVNVVLENIEHEKAVLSLALRLTAVGIRWKIWKCEAVREKVKDFSEMTNEDENVLWITDDPILAGRLAADAKAVLAYLHEHNDESSFSGVRYAFEKPEEVEIAYLEGVYRRCKRLPLDILNTERLFLRETIEADVEAFYHIYSDPAITRYMEDLYPDKEQERAYVREYIDKIYGFYDFGVWTVIKRDTGEVIGRAGFAYRDDFEDPELGFVIGVPWQRQGYAYEICSAILRYGWERLEFAKVHALVEPHNTPSLNLCEKLGMRYEETVVSKGVEYLCMTIENGTINNLHVKL